MSIKIEIKTTRHRESWEGVEVGQTINLREGHRIFVTLPAYDFYKDKTDRIRHSLIIGEEGLDGRHPLVGNTFALVDDYVVERVDTDYCDGEDGETYRTCFITCRNKSYPHIVVEIDEEDYVCLGPH